MRSEPLTCHALARGSEEVLLSVCRSSFDERAETSIDGYMRREHDRVGALLGVLVGAAARGDERGTATYLELLSTTLRRHVEVEEELILPELSSRHGQPRGPAMLLRDEHITILELLGDLTALVER